MKIIRKKTTQVNLMAAIAVVIILVCIIAVCFKVNNNRKEPDSQTATEDIVQVQKETQIPEKKPVFRAEVTDQTVDVGGEIESNYAIVIDEQEGKVVAQKNGFERMFPASMTKVMTVLVAAENIEENDLNEIVTVSKEATDYSYINDCSAAGFIDGEQVTLRDIFNGTILPSGGEAAYQLALYTAGSLEGFVEMMNEKVAELGLAETTHFTNPVGIFNEENYSTAYDIAVIMQAAMENEICREVLSNHTYGTSVTEQHPDKLVLSNLFLRRIEDHITSGEVIGAKTGYVNQSGSCAVSYEISESQKTYICVTGGAPDKWTCIYNHVDLYAAYAK